MNTNFPYSLSNCDEVIQFLIKCENDEDWAGSSEHWQKCIEFQGDKVNYALYQFDVDSAVFPYGDYVFFVSNQHEANRIMFQDYDYFTVFIAEKHARIIELPGIRLPLYVMEEMIATLKGEW